jgi:predicted nucleic acid-binding protein
MDKPGVYIETSIVSYLAARPARDPVTLRNQQLTHTWWNTQRERYALYTSVLTLAESARGNPAIAQRRLELLAPPPITETRSSVPQLAEALSAGLPLPAQATADAEHIALAATGGLEYLLTWDRKHIANPRLLRRIESVLGLWGYATVVFCTPGELMSDI